MAPRHINPTHPGEALRETLDRLNVTVTDFAAHIGVARSTVNRVLACSAGISPDMSMRLGEALGQPADLWFMRQAQHDLALAAAAKRKRIKPLGKAA